MPYDDTYDGNDDGAEEEDELLDWQLSCFMKKRHKEKIEGSNSLPLTWKMKEKVCKLFCFYFTLFSYKAPLIYTYFTITLFRLGILYNNSPCLRVRQFLLLLSILNNRQFYLLSLWILGLTHPRH